MAGNEKVPGSWKSWKKREENKSEIVEEEEVTPITKRRLSESEDELVRKKIVTSEEPQPEQRAAADKNWSVEECRGSHECEEHWELRKQFLMENMDRFSKERLICLSQVFANVEFLGCRYPDATMELVTELSVGIVESYRESQKTRLQRTFVKASDAAERKTKRL